LVGDQLLGASETLNWRSLRSHSGSLLAPFGDFFPTLLGRRSIPKTIVIRIGFGVLGNPHYSYGREGDFQAGFPYSLSAMRPYVVSRRSV
jgi:hypothetical protein